MPTVAKPEPWPTPLPGTVHYERTYRDVLGRAMTGTVTITGQTRLEQGGTVVPAAPVDVKVVDGTLSVDLPPDEYLIVATLRTVEGVKVVDRETVTVS